MTLGTGRLAVAAVAGAILLAGCGSDGAADRADGAPGATTPRDVTTPTSSGRADVTIVLETADGSDAEVFVAAVAERLASIRTGGGTEIAHDGARLTVSIPGASSDPEKIAELLARRGLLQFRPVLTVEPGGGCERLGGATPTADIVPDATVVLPGGDLDLDATPDSCLQLGPVPSDGEHELTGAVVTAAEAVASAPAGTSAVEVGIDDAALELFNATAESCFALAPACPTGQLAIALDDQVLTAPVIQQPRFDAAGIVISGAFTEEEAGVLAATLRAGALPAELVVVSVTAR